MHRYTHTYNPFLDGFGAAQWTDYAPPASWAGLGNNDQGTHWQTFAPWAGPDAGGGMGDYVQLPYSGIGQEAGTPMIPMVAVAAIGLWWWMKRRKKR